MNIVHSERLGLAIVRMKWSRNLNEVESVVGLFSPNDTYIVPPNVLIVTAALGGPHCVVVNIVIYCNFQLF
jgi:hypothetical protein